MTPQFHDSVTMILWLCDSVFCDSIILWSYNSMILQFCDPMTPWFHGSVALWICNFVILWFCDSVTLWFYNSMSLQFQLHDHILKKFPLPPCASQHTMAIGQPSAIFWGLSRGSHNLLQNVLWSLLFLQVSARTPKLPELQGRVAVKPIGFGAQGFCWV